MDGRKLVCFWERSGLVSLVKESNYREAAKGVVPTMLATHTRHLFFERLFLHEYSSASFVYVYIINVLVKSDKFTVNYWL